jgi:hypothetical protein
MLKIEDIKPGLALNGLEPSSLGIVVAVAFTFPG